MILFRKPAIFNPFPHLVAAESTRHGGISPPPYASLNLGLNTGDDPEHVLENRRIFFGKLGIPLERVVGSKQVHGKEVLAVEKPGYVIGYDALITNKPDLFLTVTIADCTPILLFHPKTGAIACIHAGWRGTVAKVVARAVNQLKESYDATPHSCYAYVGTAIDADNYEVGDEVARHFDQPFKRWDAARRKFFVDLKAANTAQLIETGIPPSQIEISPFSTHIHNSNYFSHRKERGKTGRLLAVIGRRSKQ